MNTITDNGRRGWLTRAAMAAHADAVQAEEERARLQRRNYEDAARQALQDAVARVIGITVDVDGCPWGRAEDGEDRPYIILDGLDFSITGCRGERAGLVLIVRCESCHVNKRDIPIPSLAELGRLLAEDRGRYCCSPCEERQFRAACVLREAVPA